MNRKTAKKQPSNQSGGGKESQTGDMSAVKEAMQQELHQLKSTQVTQHKQARRVRLKAVREEKMRQRHAFQQKRRLLKLEQAEKRLSLKAAKEKQMKAKLLLKDAKKSQRAAEKERKKRELVELVARKKEERRRVCQLSRALTQGQGSTCCHGNHSRVIDNHSRVVVMTTTVGGAS